MNNSTMLREKAGMNKGQAVTLENTATVGCQQKQKFED